MMIEGVATSAMLAMQQDPQQRAVTAEVQPDPVVVAVQQKDEQDQQMQRPPDEGKALSIDLTA